MGRCLVKICIYFHRSYTVRKERDKREFYILQADAHIKSKKSDIPPYRMLPLKRHPLLEDLDLQRPLQKRCWSSEPMKTFLSRGFDKERSWSANVFINGNVRKLSAASYTPRRDIPSLSRRTLSYSSAVYFSSSIVDCSAPSSHQASPTITYL